MNDIILELNKIGQNYFHESKFKLKQKNFTTWIIEGNSSAVNYHKNVAHEVKVLKWFDDVWIYIEISFVSKQRKRRKRKKQLPNIFFTLSVFQGKDNDNTKIQLFRAEWDNYEDLSDKHPQPHWHIYPFHKYVEDFIELIKEDEEDFNSFLKKENFPEIIDLKRFHFAMNGQWSENKPDVHKINMEDDLLNWFAGVLNHIKKQLEYVKEK
ncbi:MAG: hypothetical protein ACTSPW_19385 [Promethearchaeota archaeon]